MSLFFTLSGFVIQYNYGLLFASKGIKAASKHFLLARFARLYPLYLVGLILSASFIGMGFLKDMLPALSCITLTQTWFNLEGATGDIIAGSWSISTEFFLYLFFIPLAAPISRITRPLPWLIALCIAALIVVVLLGAFRDSVTTSLGFLQLRDPKVSAPPFYWLMYFSPLIRCFEFFGGALAARFYQSASKPRCKSRSASIVVFSCVAWCVLVILLLCRAGNQIIEALLPNFIFAPAIITILIVVCRFKTDLTRLMSSPLMLNAGKISYSVYLLQALVFVAVANAFDSSISSAIARSSYAILITTALGYGVYHLFESPARQWIRSLPKRLTRETARMSPAPLNRCSLGTSNGEHQEKESAGDSRVLVAASSQMRR
jgi:peptidoglycan/LPS O-acetylase OafA/YrhL